VVDREAGLGASYEEHVRELMRNEEGEEPAAAEREPGERFQEG